MDDFDLLDTSLTPTINIPALDSNALTLSTIPATAPASNVNQSAGFNINQVTSALANMFDNGVAVYNNVAKTLGTPQIGATAAAPVAAPQVFGGLSTTQWLIIGGGVGLVALLLITKRR